MIKAQYFWMSFGAAAGLMALVAAVLSFAFAHLTEATSGGGDSKLAGDIANGPVRAQRIVSLDYCADQYVLKFVDRARILALSPDAEADYSYLRAAAKGVPTVFARAEDVLALRPDLVVRSYGGGPNAAAFFERAGVRVVQIGWMQSFDDIRRVTLETATALGAAGLGRQTVAEMEAALQRAARNSALADQGQRPTALYITPGGVTTGPGSLVHEMMVMAGLENFEARPGWRDLPLERLARERPDIAASAFFGSEAQALNAWSPARHPVARAAANTDAQARLSAASVSCGAWFAADAVVALAEASEDGR